MKIIFALLTSFVLLFGFLPAEERHVTGIVTDNHGKPVALVRVVAQPSGNHTATDSDGKYKLKLAPSDTHLNFVHASYNRSFPVKGKAVLNVRLDAGVPILDEVLIVGAPRREKHAIVGALAVRALTSASSYVPSPNGLSGQESYAPVAESGFKRTDKEPLSTFSADVDAASYSNVRRFINAGSLPPADAVRVEELINYFDYGYPAPAGNEPVNIMTEAGQAPWNKKHQLVKIALQARRISTETLPASNLVFLIDVSGSMADPNKLPLLVSSFKMLTEQLRAKDKVAIVVYAGSSGLALPPTPGDKKAVIRAALDRLSAGGSTAGGAGLELAYRTAAGNFIKGGNNRVILATDGDFNVGQSSDETMKKLIENKRQSGIFLTVLGYGMGNYKDSKMETLADKGNGNYAYIDNIQEARKVLVNEFGGTLFTVAKDVKLQVEFNPATIQAYRLVGYENRLLADEDFNNDRKDAGDMGSGHNVTAFYEVIPTGVKSEFTAAIDPLKYQQAEKKARTAVSSTELLTVKMRYKHPQSDKSMLITKTLDRGALSIKPSAAFQFASAVAEFGMLLRNSEYKQRADYNQLIERARASRGPDNEGYRAEFIRLAGAAAIMAKDLLTSGQKHMPDEKN
ncbi:hypothetical protein C7T94_03110 [Pedobacter yulinensis]|uniref:VWFA domain-containing protein n=1 Tax=Pedobacter yulinensis TaxID=2126353 RepID=A0A2T3HSE5_9SPHI|nr:VWA domain-containing protein [Pedobacter yulinensis]PST85307.1 hypothetical protein C7T94_03110 [Pedobacter yulinensis]